MSAFEEAGKSRATDRHPDGQLATNRIFEEFCRDRESIEALKVTPQELQALSHASLLGTLTSMEDVLFVLRQIRKTVTRAKESMPDPGAMAEAIRRAAYAKLTELDSRNAKRNRALWRRLKVMLDWRDHSRLPYRTSWTRRFILSHFRMN
jgi:hypothetical protein